MLDSSPQQPCEWLHQCDQFVCKWFQLLGPRVGLSIALPDIIDCPREPLRRRKRKRGCQDTSCSQAGCIFGLQGCCVLFFSIFLFRTLMKRPSFTLLLKAIPINPISFTLPSKIPVDIAALGLPSFKHNDHCRGRALAPARLRVCILGGTAFLNNESADLVKDGRGPRG